MQKLMRVSSISELKEDKRGRPYYTVKFLPANETDKGQQVFSALGEGTRNVSDEFIDDKGNIFKADTLFKEITANRLQLDALVEGQVVKVNTSDYFIEGDPRPKNTKTYAIYDHEDLVKYVNADLAPDACLIDDDGNETAEIVRPTKAPAKMSV